jgi:hypothetical protein
MLYNLLDFPAGVVPVKFVDQEDIARHMPVDQKPIRGMQENVERPLDRVDEFSRYAIGDSLGLPVGVQVIALPN